MKSFYVYEILISIFILSFSYSLTKAQNNQIRTIIKSIQQQYAPDRRTAVFNVSYRKTKSGIIVRGEVNNPEAKKAVIDALHTNEKVGVIDKICVLPDSALGQNIYGIILVNVADIKRKPDKNEELISQALMGTVVTILKKTNGYYFIQMPDKYLGWIELNSLVAVCQLGVDAWQNEKKVIVIEMSGIVLEKPELSSMPICEVSIGCIFKCDSMENEWTLIELADGKQGFVQTKIVRDFGEWNKNHILSGKNLEKTAKSFLGTTYLWGGNSARGMDCSGFTKIVYWLNGFELNRDANQQAEQGIHIEPGKDYKNFRKGDLLFFGQKATAKRKEHITHVGMYIEKEIFIHSSGKVKLGSFDPGSKIFDKNLKNKFVRARRIINM